MMKKLVLALLLCLPLAAAAQVKPGIPISEVVRQAQAEMAEQKRNKRVSQDPNIRIEQQDGRQVVPAHNPHLVIGPGPVIYREPRAVRTPRAATEPAPTVYRAPRAPRPIPLARAPRAPHGGFDNQLDFDRQFGLSLSTNALMWALATPNLDLRLQYDKFSLVGSFAYAGWNMPEQKFWWITSIGAELRYDVIPNVYVGLMYNWLNYNIKFGGTGNQGTANAVGIVAGYKLPIGRKLALDFGIGLGYALVENEKYHDEGQVFIRDERRTYGYWGLTKAQVSLVWRIL